MYFADDSGRRAAAKLLTYDEARRIATNIAKLPPLAEVRVAAFVAHREAGLIASSAFSRSRFQPRRIPPSRLARRACDASSYDSLSAAGGIGRRSNSFPQAAFLDRCADRL